MEQCIFRVREQTLIAADVRRMILVGDVSGITNPGQFVNISIPGFFLRRPFGVCDLGEDRLTVIYKVVGAGTDVLAQAEAGTELSVLIGLGNGFSTEMAGDSPLLIGGGLGAAPLFYLARCLLLHGSAPRVVLGFNRAQDVFLANEFRSLGIETTIVTVDGSVGLCGFVTDALPDHGSYFYACGPTPMLKAVCQRIDIPGECSLEARMGCGFGACMGCSIQTTEGSKRICRDGPVFSSGLLLWN